MAAQDPELRRQVAQQARLWLLALVCATVGAVVVARTDRLAPGVLAFLAALVVLGPLLWLYEKRRPSPEPMESPARRRPRG